MLILAAQTPAPTSSRLWLVVLVAILVLALVGLGIFLLMRRRQQRGISSGVPGGLPRNRLKLVWQRFLGGLPRSAQTVVEFYPWVIVMGPQGAGKTEVINGRVDWQGQASQLFPMPVGPTKMTF